MSAITFAANGVTYTLTVDKNRNADVFDLALALQQNTEIAKAVERNLTADELATFFRRADEAYVKEFTHDGNYPPRLPKSRLRWMAEAAVRARAEGSE